MPEAMSNITAVGRVAVAVSDQDRAIAFYVDTLGFEKVADVPFGGDERWVEVAPPGSSTSLALVPQREGAPAGVMTNVFLTTTDVEADHARLLAAGVDVDAEVMRMGDPVPPMFFFKDPDGNGFGVVQ
jgi:catechol 2,3-dioxygenase-like lactoylglutathione lyase family enzyme